MRSKTKITLDIWGFTKEVDLDLPEWVPDTIDHEITDYAGRSFSLKFCCMTDLSGGWDGPIRYTLTNGEYDYLADSLMAE